MSKECSGRKQENNLNSHEKSIRAIIVVCYAVYYTFTDQNGSMNNVCDLQKNCN